MHDLDDYPFQITHLSAEDGGGFLISYPDFDSCISDGETVEEAICNGRDALQAVMDTLRENGHPIPVPGNSHVEDKKFLQHLPKPLRTKLAARAETEGVSMDALITRILAENLEHPTHR